MKAWKWTQEPVTWGGYAKLCAICYAIALVISSIYAVAIFWPNWWEDFKEFVMKPVTWIKKKVSRA